MYIILTSHTENDRRNGAGLCKNIPEKDQTFSHLNKFFEMIDDSGLPVTQSLTVGGMVGKRLVEHVRDNETLPKKTEVSMHMHCDKWNNGWHAARPATVPEADKIYSQFSSVFGRPKSCVFGHFLLNKNLIGFLSKNKIYVDGSYSPLIGHKFTVKQPFAWENVTEVPVVSNMDYPLNPFIYGQHMDILKRIMQRHGDEKAVLHTYFHSYDFFNFGKGSIKSNGNSRSLFFRFSDLVDEFGCKLIFLKDAKKIKFQKFEINSKIIVPKATVFKERLNKLIRITRDKL